MYHKMGQFLAATVFALSMGAGLAVAQPTLTYTQKQTGAGLAPLTITKTDAPTANVTNAFVGEIFLKGISVNPVGSIPGINGATTQLQAWCIDIFGVLAANGTYNAVQYTPAVDAAKINALISAGDGADNIFSNSEAAATQLAIWKVVYGKTNINSNDSSLNTLANNYYDYATNGTNGFTPDSSKYVLGLLENPNTAQQQQLVTLLSNGTPPGGNQTVPEPASLALVSVGLLGLGLVRRRRSK